MSFYNTSSFENTANPFSEKVLESSPLSRVLKQAAPGNDWAVGQGHEIKRDYQTNITGEVKRFDVSLTADYVPSITAIGSYDANVLYKTVTTDENNNATEEFKDKEGRVILKRTYDNNVAHNTYYVYDQFGNLTYVIPPLADGSITSTELDGLCYQYKYDNFNRLAAKKLPWAEAEFAAILAAPPSPPRIDPWRRTSGMHKIRKRNHSNNWFNTKQSYCFSCH